MKFQRTLVDNIGWFQATCQPFFCSIPWCWRNLKVELGTSHNERWKIIMYTKMTAIKIQVGSLQVFTNWTFTDIAFSCFFSCPAISFNRFGWKKMVGSSVIGNPIARSIGTATGHAGSSEFLVPMDQHASWRIWCGFLIFSGPSMRPAIFLKWVLDHDSRCNFFNLVWYRCMVYVKHAAMSDHKLQWASVGFLAGVKCQRLKSSELRQPRIITAISDSLSLFWRRSDFLQTTGVLLICPLPDGPVPWRYDNLGFLGALWLGEFCKELLQGMGRGHARYTVHSWVV